AVAEGGQLALLRRPRLEQDTPRATGATAGHPVGGDERVLHPGGQLRALAQDAHVADHAHPAPVQAGPARVRSRRVALDPQREIALDVLARVVLLGDVVDHAHAVGERSRAEADAQTLDA